MENIFTLEEFISRFKRVKELGWIKTHRAGRTGIGKTLEDLLDIKENNIQGPDFGEYELKSARKNSNSMLTLITKSPDTKSANTVLRLLNALTFTTIANTGHKLKVTPVDNKIYIEDENGLTDIFWSVEILERQLTKKLGNKFIYVKADNHGTNKNEEFYYETAYLVEGFSASKIIDLIRTGAMYIDLRIGQYHGGKNNGKTHDHGTGLRIKEKDQTLLFKKITKLVKKKRSRFSTPFSIQQLFQLSLFLLASLFHLLENLKTA